MIQRIDIVDACLGRGASAAFLAADRILTRALQLAVTSVLKNTGLRAVVGKFTANLTAMVVDLVFLTCFSAWG